MNPDDLFRKLKEEAETLHIEVPDMRWEKISAALPQPQSRKRFGKLTFALIIMITLVAVLLSGIYIFITPDGDTPSALSFQKVQQSEKSADVTGIRSDKGHEEKIIASETDPRTTVSGVQSHSTPLAALKPHINYDPVQKTVSSSDPLANLPFVENTGITETNGTADGNDETPNDPDAGSETRDNTAIANIPETPETIVKDMQADAVTDTASVSDTASGQDEPEPVKKPAFRIRPSIALMLSMQPATFYYTTNSSAQTQQNNIPDTNTVSALSKDFKRKGSLMQIGAVFSVPLGGHWQLLPGIGLQSATENIYYDNRTDSVIILVWDPSSSRYRDSAVYSKRMVPGSGNLYHSRTQYLILPLSIAYRHTLGSRMLLTVSAGMQADLYLGGKTLQYNDTAELYSVARSNQIAYLSARLSAGISYRLTERWSFELSGTYQDALAAKRRGSDPRSMLYRSAGATLGLRYTFGK